MIKKIVFVLVLALMSQLIVACVDCNCPPVRTIYYTNKGIALKNMDASLPQPMITNSATISSVNYGIQIQLLTEQIASTKRQIMWGFMQSAYACSCAEDNFINKDEIVSMKITSNNDFDTNHPKAEDLSLYFKAKRNNALVPIVDYIKSIKGLSYIASNSFYDGIFLQVAPTLSKKHKFKLAITLSDGRILEAETTEVELN